MINLKRIAISAALALTAVVQIIPSASAQSFFYANPGYSYSYGTMPYTGFNGYAGYGGFANPYQLGAGIPFANYGCGYPGVGIGYGYPGMGYGYPVSAASIGSMAGAAIGMGIDAARFRRYNRYYAGVGYPYF
ncbi:MAG: hypothetical protein K2W82_08255 [Candidatus Obscuribacterales bacterium]|nr:hypothetical protein [Candidatus Obscuribacterales bacterium]